MQSRLKEQAFEFGRNAELEPDSDGKAARIQLLDFHSAPMRAFHLSWIAFFLSFVAWFGIAPLMAVVRDDLKLTKAQIGNTVIASVAITIFARLLTGWLCDRFGPRRTYSALLVFGALPVMGIGLSHSYQSFLFFRLAIGLIGASFVLTQYHTSIMFSRSVVGTANAVTAGWGNLGGGVAQWAMPLLFGAIVGFGADRFLSWRLAMIVPGALMFITGLAYYRLAEDTPDGRPFVPRPGGQAFWEAAGDYRVWLLFFLYGACFGVEITVDNVAALYFKDSFHVTLKLAGLLASLIGMMNIFARALGGIAGDWAGRRWGLPGRSRLLGLTIFVEGALLVWFSRLAILGPATAAFLLFGLFVCMACGVTYAVVPLIRPRAVGSVSGIVGAGGNLGAVLAALLFKSESLSGSNAFLILGGVVAGTSFCALLLRFREASVSLPELEPATAFMSAD
ncbi:MAG TPA: MFS transporter [Candidatus Dormibacteraeota bacterium]|nr:MFS transporter [Candidatus Dormibacteraeota bacterium]